MGMVYVVLLCGLKDRRCSKLYAGASSLKSSGLDSIKVSQIVQSLGKFSGCPLFPVLS